MKPKYKIHNEDSPYMMIVRAASILSAKGKKREARIMHQEATVYGYEFYKVLELLKKYMEI
jgi:hypothetical protein